MGASTALGGPLSVGRKKRETGVSEPSRQPKVQCRPPITILDSPPKDRLLTPHSSVHPKALNSGRRGRVPFIVVFLFGSAPCSLSKSVAPPGTTPKAREPPQAPQPSLNQQFPSFEFFWAGWVEGGGPRRRKPYWQRSKQAMSPPNRVPEASE